MSGKNKTSIIDMKVKIENNCLLRTLVTKIYCICTEGLSANCRTKDHIEYIIYRLCGGRKSEEQQFLDNSESLIKHGSSHIKTNN